MTIGEAVQELNHGGTLRVDFGNGNGGIVRLNPATNAYDYTATEGWAAGPAEPICHKGSQYISEGFLATAVTIAPYYTERRTTF